MSDLERALDAELRAFQPEQTPPFSAVLDRRRAGGRRRTALVVAAGAAVLLVVPIAWWAGSGGDQLVQEAGPPGAEPRAAFGVHQVVEAASQEAATGGVQAPAADGAAAFPGGYACGTPAPAQPAPQDGGLVACTGDGLGEAEILRLAPAALTSSAVRAATAEASNAGAWELLLELTPEGSRAFEQLTGDAACTAFDDPGRRIALVVDGVALGVPLVAQNVMCDAGISTGSVQLVLADTTQAEAEDLARRLTPP